MQHGSETMATKTIGKKRNAREAYEKKVSSKFKRWARQFDEKTIDKRKQYSDNPKVQERRGWLNKRRRVLIKTSMSLLKNEEFFDAQGNKYALLNGVIVKPHAKIYAKTDKKGNISWSSYTNEVELLDLMPEVTDPTPEEVEFKQFLNKFLSGDPEVVDLVKKKKTTMEYEDPNYEKNLKLVLKQANRKLHPELYSKPKKSNPVPPDELSESESESVDK